MLQWVKFSDEPLGSGAARGNSGNVHPTKPEKMLKKNYAIPEGSIVSNNFSKNSLKFNISIEFY